VNDAQVLTEREARRRRELDAWVAQQVAAPQEQQATTVQYKEPFGPPSPTFGQKAGQAAGQMARTATATLRTAAGAIGTGLWRGAESLAEGTRNIMEGLITVTSAVPVTRTPLALDEWSARMHGVKRVVDGLFQVVLSPAAAATGTIGAGVDTMAPGALDVPFLDPNVSAFIRMSMGGATPEAPFGDRTPMTGREVLDIVGGLLFLGGAHRAVAGRGEARGRAVPAESPRALPGGTLERKALPAIGETTPPTVRGPIPQPGTVAPRELTPTERWIVLDRLRREGKLERLMRAVEEQAAATAQRAEVLRERFPRREAEGEPARVEGRPPELQAGELVDPQGRPLPPAGEPTMTGRERERALGKTPLGEPARAQGEAPATGTLETPAGPLRTRAEILAERYPPELRDVADQAEQAVIDVMAQWERRAASVRTEAARRDLALRRQAEDAEWLRRATEKPEEAGPSPIDAELAEAGDFFTTMARQEQQAAATRFTEEAYAAALQLPGVNPATIDVLGLMVTELREARAGRRIPITERIEGKGKVTRTIAEPSTYPDYIDQLGYPRTRAGADRLAADIERVLDGKASPEKAGPIIDYANQQTARYLGEQGSANVELLARMAVGALIGGSTGDTPEERIQNGLLGMGLGAILSRQLARTFVERLKQRGPVGEPGPTFNVILIPNLRWIEASEKVKTFLSEITQESALAKEVEAQARGVRPRAETEAAALRLIKGGRFRAQKVLDFEPGTILNAEQAAAARMLTIASANRAVRIAGEVKAGRASIDDLHAAVALSGRMVANTHAVMTEQGRALNALGMTVSGDVPLKISPERLAEVAAQAPRDARLVDIVLDLAAEHGPEQVGRFARAWSALPDALMELYYGFLLSNPLTQLRNTVGNTLATVTALAERQAAGVGAAFNPFAAPSKAHVALGEAGQMAVAGLETLRDSLRLAYRAARSAEANVTKLDTPFREPAITAERFGMDPATPWGGFVNGLGSVVRAPLRGLEITDTFFKALSFSMERKALALRHAEFEGLTGEAKAARIAELWRDPPEWLMTQAWDFAREQTFSRDFEGRMASLQRGLSHPLLKMTMLPFFRTPLRLAEYAAVRTPVLNLITSQFWGDLQAGGARRELAMAKLGTGAAIATAVSYAVLQDLITGNPPKDAGERRRAEEAGVQWKSIYNPASRRYYSYDNLEPISSIVATVADTVTLMRKLPDVEDVETRLGQLVTAVTLSATRNLASKQYLESVGRFLDAVQEPDTNAALKTLQRQLASWVPAIVGQAERIYDPAMRETETLLEEFQAKIPGLSETLVPRRNVITGEPLPHGGFTREKTTDPVLLEILRLDGAGIRAPRPYVAGRAPTTAPIPMEEPSAGQGIDLNKREYDRLIVLMTQEPGAGGRTLHQALGDLIASPNYQRQGDGQDGGKALLLRNVYHAYVESARARLRQENPELEAKIRRRMEERRFRLTPSDQPAGAVQQLMDTLGR
jgi:hypothetical protein